MTHTSRDFDTIARQIKGIEGTTSDLPGAWWVGTDKTLPLRDTYLEKDDEARKAVLELCRDLGVAETWYGSKANFVTSFELPAGVTEIKGLREDVYGHLVPDLRYSSGKDAARRMEEINAEYVNPGSAIGGFSGRVTKIQAGRRYEASPHFYVFNDSHPFVTLAAEPKEGEIVIDESKWEKVPVSWLARIIEGQ